MREIKFRAWDGNMMIYQKDNTASAMNGLALFAEKVGAVRGMTPDVMQFTGLKDKNGVEIYEGDIVTGQYSHYDPCLDEYVKDEKMGGVVYYDYHHYSLEVVERLCDKKRYGMVNYFEFIDESEHWAPKTFDDMEVIGNIHENPELLQ